MTAPIAGDEGKTGYITETIAADVSVIDPEIQNFDLYSVGYDNKKTVQPFVHQLNIDTGIGGTIQIWANIDDGAFVQVQHNKKPARVLQTLNMLATHGRWEPR